MGALIAAAVIGVAGTVGGSMLAADGAKKSAAASAASAADLQQTLLDAADEASAAQTSLAQDLLKTSKKALSEYATTAKDVVKKMEFTPVRGVLEPDQKGVSTFDKVLSVLTDTDAARRKRILGDSEPSVRAALQNFADLAAGKTSAFTSVLRASDAAVAANTRGAPLGTFANLSAANRFNFMQQGAQTASGLVNLLSSFETQTPVVAQTALAVNDQVTREASRKDSFTASQAAANLDIAHNIFNAKIATQGAFTQMMSNAATARANALVGAAQAGNLGSNGAGTSSALAGQAVAGAASAVSQGLSAYRTQQIQSQQQATISNYSSPAATGAGTYNPSTGSFDPNPY